MTMAHASANAADMDLQILERELQQISTALENGTNPGVPGVAVHRKTNSN